MGNLSILKFFRTNRSFAYMVMLLVLLVTVLTAICLGSVKIPMKTVMLILGQESVGLPFQAFLDTTDVQIVMNIRLPRVVLAFLVGASLALAGAAFQGLLQNPLADPYTLGISSGASLGSVSVIVFGGAIASVWIMPTVSIVAAFLTLLVVLFFAHCITRTLAIETVILIGIIVSAFLSAQVALLMVFAEGELKQVVYWLMGSVGMRGWSHVLLMLPFFLVGTVMLFVSRQALNAFMYGERTARYVGVSVQRHKYSIFVAATMLTGSAVAVSGAIGFVGLVIPHMVRTLAGSDYTHVLPLSLMLGGAFLVVADLLARTVLMPSELPLGVVTALVGAPLFAWLLYRYHARARKEVH